MNATDILGGPEAVLNRLKDKLGDACPVDLKEVTRNQVLNLLWEQGVSFSDVFAVDSISPEALSQWNVEMEMKCGAQETMFCLGICALGELCKPPEPLSPEKIAKINEARKRFAATLG